MIGDNFLIQEEIEKILNNNITISRQDVIVLHLSSYLKFYNKKKNKMRIKISPSQNYLSLKIKINLDLCPIEYLPAIVVILHLMVKISHKISIKYGSTNSH